MAAVLRGLRFPLVDLAKLDLRDRPQAIVLAHECGLVEEQPASPGMRP